MVGARIRVDMSRVAWAPWCSAGPVEAGSGGAVETDDDEGDEDNDAEAEREEEDLDRCVELDVAGVNEVLGWLKLAVDELCTGTGPPSAIFDAKGFPCTETALSVVEDRLRLGATGDGAVTEEELKAILDNLAALIAHCTQDPAVCGLK
jgi:hypothetical protein